MSEQKSFLMYVAEMVEQYRADRRHNSPREPRTQPSRLRRFLRWLTPNGGTLLLVAALIVTAQVWARPLTSPANAPGPSATTVNYQGRLANPDGTPVADNTYAMSFSLWDAPTDGNLVWGTEDHAVPVSGGLFSVGLGSKNPIPTTTWNGDRYLEITVSGETLSPRELIRSVPIAGMALTVPDGAVTSEKMAPTIFSTYSSGQVPIGGAWTEVLSLNLDFPVDATYLISVRVSCKRDQTGRMISVLRDEMGNDIIGSGIHTQHLSGGIGGTQTGSVTVTQDLSAGAHTLRLFTSAGPGDVRSAHIIAIPFAQAP